MKNMKCTFKQLFAIFALLFSLGANSDTTKDLLKIEFKKPAPKNVISLLKNIPNNEEPLPSKVLYAKFDLNNDKEKEYFLLVRDRTWCGAGYCPIFIFQEKKIVRLLLISSIDLKLYILSHKTKGYHDISFYPETELDRYIWHWNGKEYK